MYKKYTFLALSFMGLVLPLFNVMGQQTVVSQYNSGMANINPQYQDRRFVDPNYYYYGVANGAYTGTGIGLGTSGGSTTTQNLDVNFNSGTPGMNDDSNALYDSYLKANGQ